MIVFGKITVLLFETGSVKTECLNWFTEKNVVVFNKPEYCDVNLFQELLLLDVNIQVKQSYYRDYLTLTIEREQNLISFKKSYISCKNNKKIGNKYFKEEVLKCAKKIQEIYQNQKTSLFQ